MPPMWKYLRSLWQEPRFRDFPVQCRNGITFAPRLIMIALFRGTHLFPVVSEEDDVCLILSDVTVSQFENGLKTIFYGLRSDNVSTIMKIFSWIDWEPWRQVVTKEASSTEPEIQQQQHEPEQVVGSILMDVIRSLPLKAKFLSKGGKKSERFKCRICGKLLADKNSLRKHEEVVHFNIRRFECNFCCKRFATKIDLEDHFNAIHGIGKSSVCEICGLLLANRHSLRTHKLLHSEGKESSFKCPHCPKSFRHKSTCKKHISRIHEFEPAKKLKCNHCGKLLNHEEGLRRHVIKMHGENRKYPCEFCSSAFAFNYDLNKHLKRFHQGIESVRIRLNK